MTKYKLIFNGQLLEGTDRETCVRELAKLFKKHPEIIDKKLFNGKKTIVKTTTDRVVVDRYIAAFKRAGALLLVKHEIMGDTKASEKKPYRVKSGKGKKGLPVKKIVDKKHSGKRKGKKRGGLDTEDFAPGSRSGITLSSRIIMGFAVLVLLVALCCFGYYWLNNTLLNADVPAIVVDVENALATKDVIAIGHGNIKKAVELENLFLEEPDKDALDIQDETSFIGKLSKYAIDPRQAISQIVVSIHAKGELLLDLNAYYSFIVLGTFDTDKIKTFIENEYETETADFNETVTLFRKQDIESCAYSPMQAIYMENSRLIITTPNAMESILHRLNTKEEAEIDLGSWREYRKDKLACVGLFSPEHSDKAAGSGMINMLIRQLKEHIGPVSSGFAGITPHVFPPGVKIDVGLNSNDQIWIDSKTGELKELLDIARKNLTETSSLSADLFDYLTIMNHPGVFRAEIVLNKKLFENIGELASEFMGSLFSGMGDAPVGTTAPKKEKLEGSPKRFYAQIGFGNLEAFTKVKSPFFKPDWSSGPFGLFIENIAYTETGDIEVTLKAEGREIKNLGDSKKRISLEVTSVLNSSGEELLKEEPCGQNRNSLPGYFGGNMQNSYFEDNKTVYYLKTNAEKKIRLKKGVDVSGSLRLNGAIVLNLPVKTRRILLESPFVGKVVQSDDVRLVFKKGAKSKVAYELSGDYDKILAIRALNKDQKVLSKSSGFSMDRFWGGGKSADKEYHGEIAFVEVILVEESLQKKYPFTLPTILPKQENSKYPHTLEKIPTTTLALFDKKLSELKPLKITEKSRWLGELDSDQVVGPFVWKLYGFKVNSYWGTKGRLHLYSPQIHSLANNLSAVSIFLDDAKVADGGTRLLNYSDYVLLERQGGYFHNGVFKPDPERDYLKGQKNIQLAYKEERPKKLNGKIMLRLPVEISSITLPNLNLGSQITKGGFQIHVMGIGRGSMELSITGKRERLISFNLHDASGNGVQSSVSYIEDQGNSFKVNIGFNGMPEKLTMLFAKKMESREFPFSLKLK